MAFAVVFLPLLAAAIAGFFGRAIGDRGAQLVTCGALLLSMVLGILLFRTILAQESAQIIPLASWIVAGGVDVQWSLRLDTLSGVMIIAVTIVSAMVHVYSVGYMAHDRGIARFMSYLSLFTFFMLMLVTANDFVQLFFGWEGVGLMSYLLIGFWYDRASANEAAIKAFIVNRVGDFGFALGIFAVFVIFGSLDFTTVFGKAPGAVGTTINFLGWQVPSLTLACILLFVGAMGKSAQLGLHTWLPDAMEGPTPVSALIHAATMVTAGVYLVARSTPLFAAAGPVLAGVGVVGALTAIFAATIALVQFDIKRVMAYSTVSQLGYMFLALGAGAPIAAMFHLITHAFFKALLFLGSGSVIHGIGDVQDMRRMGGLRAKMPLTYWTMVIAGGALAALPPLAGFWSKDEILGSAFANGYPILWAVGVFTGGLTAFYITRAIWLTFHGQPRDRHLFDHAHESPRIMTWPLLALAAGSALVGFIGFPPDHGFLHAFLRPAIEAGAAPSETGTNWQQFLLFAAISTAVGVGGILFGLSMYGRGRPDPAAVSRAAGPYYDVLVNKYYVDEVYDRRFVELAKAVAGASWAFDIHIIDGLVNRLGWAIKAAGGGLRRAQTGIVGNYALSIVAGLLVIMVVYGGYATGWLRR